jgi:hypothetical protein
VTRVFLWFLIPLGMGISPGVLLARDLGLRWPLAAALYFVSDLVLAAYFEPILRWLIRLAARRPTLARVAAEMRKTLDRVAALLGGAEGGPIGLILFTYGVDPMSGRAMTMAAGHGVFSGWALVIAGDMLYYGTVAASTLAVDSWLGNKWATVAVITVLMVALPPLIRRVKMALLGS